MPRNVDKVLSQVEYAKFAHLVVYIIQIVRLYVLLYQYKNTQILYKTKIFINKKIWSIVENEFF